MMPGMPMLNSEISLYAEKRKRVLELAGLFLFVFLFAVSLLTAVNETLLFTVKVEGSSMSPTLKSGNVVLVSRTADVQRGSVVVIQTEDGGPIIKRVIALPGETVWSVRGKVYLMTASGNITLSEDYISTEYTGWADIVRTQVPQGCVFLMGDNRAVSYDSRSFGPLRMADIMGVVTPFWLKHQF